MFDFSPHFKRFQGRSAGRLSAPKVPSLCHHKPSGQAYVRLNGQAIYLGPYDDPMSRREYDRLIAEWLAAGRQVRQPQDEMRITELAARYWRHVQEYYVNAAGEPTHEQGHMQVALAILRSLYGDTRVADFGPKALLTVRHKMVARGWTRLTVNQAIGRIKRLFRWATEQELVPGSTFHAISSVAGLRRGRTEAPDGEPVKPVPAERIQAVKPFVSRQVWGMIQMQLLTAARPGEVCTMRPRDIDRTGSVWVYHPSEHKTSFRGYERNIYIGPRAQKELSAFLLRGPEEYCFSPMEAQADRRKALHEARVTPMNSGNSPGTNRRSHPEKEPGPCYTTSSYWRAIQYACDQAFPPPPPLGQMEGETAAEYRRRLTSKQREELRAWKKAHRWHPHQLRHNAATELRKEHGLEAARIILGHRSPAVTMIYAEVDKQRAIDVIEKVG